MKKIVARIDSYINILAEENATKRLRTQRWHLHRHIEIKKRSKQLHITCMLNYFMLFSLI